MPKLFAIKLVPAVCPGNVPNQPGEGIEVNRRKVYDLIPPSGNLFVNDGALGLPRHLFDPKCSRVQRFYEAFESHLLRISSLISRSNRAASSARGVVIKIRRSILRFLALFSEVGSP